MDVVGQRLQRRDVDDLRPVAQPAIQPLPHQAVQAVRKAARVLPEPVGAAISVCCPPRDGGPSQAPAHPWAHRTHRRTSRARGDETGTMASEPGHLLSTLARYLLPVGALLEGALTTQWKHICSHPVNLAHEIKGNA